MRGKILCMIAAFFVVFTSTATAIDAGNSPSVGKEKHLITIEPDDAFPGWDDYDLALENLKIIPQGFGVISVRVDVRNLGLCKACSGYGWYSPDGRSCWGEWDFQYDKNDVVDIKIRVGDTSPEPGATYRVELDGTYLGDFEVPATNSWYIVTIHDVDITQGKHTLFLGTYDMDYNPDMHLDYIIIGDKRIEAESYDRMGGNDPDPNLRGLSVYPRDIKLQIWEGEPPYGELLREIVVGKEQTVIDRGDTSPQTTRTAHYIENNGSFHTEVICKLPYRKFIHEIYVVLDPDNELNEINENNNILSTKIIDPTLLILIPGGLLILLLLIILT